MELKWFNYFRNAYLLVAALDYMLRDSQQALAACAIALCIHLIFIKE